MKIKHRAYELYPSYWVEFLKMVFCVAINDYKTLFLLSFKPYFNNAYAYKTENFGPFKPEEEEEKLVQV